MAKKTLEQKAQEETISQEVNDIKTIEESKVEDIPAPPVTEKKIIENPKGLAVETQNQERLSIEEKIARFLKNRNVDGFIPINDFLKSLYPLAKINEPKAWHDQRTMKALKNTLDGMVKSGQILIESNRHQQLAKFYYPDNNPVTHYYNLDTLPLKAKLA